MQAIGNAQMQLQAVSESINRAHERRLLIERQLVDAETFPVEATQPVPAATAPAPAAVPSTATQLEMLKTQLDLQRLRYTADHPDVRSLERTIRDLQAKLKDEGGAQVPQEAPLARRMAVEETARSHADLDSSITSWPPASGAGR